MSWLGNLLRRRSAPTPPPPTKDPAVTDYARAAAQLGVEEAAVEAVARVESSGSGFWTINGDRLPVIRLEAHWFGKLTGYRYNDTHPQISCRAWTPSLAARSPAGAWQQFDEAAALDQSAAIQATSWGAFQIMGFHWKALGYASPQAMRDDMESDAGQLNAFVRFIETDPVLLDALRRRDWYSFAGRYNGPGQIDVYANRMAQAYQQASA